MCDGDIHMYQITDPSNDYFLYEYRLNYLLPFENDKEIYIYYPFMKEKYPIGKTYIEVDGNGTHYAWADIYGNDIELSFTCFPGTYMATYSCLYQD